MKPAPFLLVASLALALPLHAQNPMEPFVKATQAEMAKLAALKGRWEGKGWIDMGRGPMHFQSQETVSEKIGGSAYLIEGLHKDATSGAVVHDAVAILSYDVGTKGYRMATAVNHGRGGMFPAALEGNKLTWTLERPGAPTQRYVITLEPDRWTEVGERRSTDGKWTPFFRMELNRVK